MWRRDDKKGEVTQSDSYARFYVVLALVAVLWLPLCTRRDVMAGQDDEVCDVDADYFLGIEDYPVAIRLHQDLLRKHPDNALAHYHLGFAEGMMANTTTEVAEYQRAGALGLKNWDLFLNLGVAQSESNDLEAARKSLQEAVCLGEEHPESHFNLALVDEELGLLADAERETLASLELSPGQADERNLQGVIYAEEGKTARAAQVFRKLSQDEPARQNLRILSASEATAVESGPASSHPASAVNSLKEEHQVSLARSPGRMALKSEQ